MGRGSATDGMGNRARQTGLLAAAILAAYLLVLQTVLGGLAMGTHAGMGVALGPAGEVICLNTTTPDGQQDTAGHLPDCCTSSCRLGALASLPPPELAPLPSPLALPALALAGPRVDSPASGTEHLPHNARAPPVA
ncbi:hypothetical protein [Ancylobacter defluvii]|uniref:DUF2946 domain-containing protein n=2 Tax=Ancylobacter defluvii TaxID=1282440 RepID=A0A9W6NDP4_9HYPH|nr:hypothetical protein [Ancylobacter defluvii]GLK86756.1 hypothetical protein GCM10017653_48260 [Ancylobacter defluvii]